MEAYFEESALGSRRMVRELPKMQSRTIISLIDDARYQRAIGITAVFLSLPGVLTGGYLTMEQFIQVKVFMTSFNWVDPAVTLANAIGMGIGVRLFSRAFMGTSALRSELQRRG